MLIQLNGDYRITTDSMNIELRHRRVGGKGKSEGKEIWQVIGNYPNLEQGVKGCIRHHINTNDLEGVQEIIDAIMIFTDEIVHKMQEVKNEKN